MADYRRGIGFDVKKPPKPKGEKTTERTELAKALLKQHREQSIIWNGHGN